MFIPCGQCIGCRLERAQQWATRMHHEASLHEASSFVTLTYADHRLPSDGSVSVKELQDFFKRLRYRVPQRLRYYACGEYGDQRGRPHYHAIIFGCDFDDKLPWRVSGSGYLLYRSRLLEEVWPFGHCEVGTVSHESAGYCARYCLKKVNGELAKAAYLRPHPVTGELHQVRPEFAVMSRRPGIGAGWYDRYKSDAFPSDFVIIDGGKRAVPRFYKKKLDEDETLRVNAARAMRAFKHADNNTPERLAVREELAHLRAGQLIRPLESEQ